MSVEQVGLRHEYDSDSMTYFMKLSMILSLENFNWCFFAVRHLARDRTLIIFLQPLFIFSLKLKTWAYFEKWVKNEKSAKLKYRSRDRYRMIS